jgi:hypothetical protein
MHYHFSNNFPLSRRLPAFPAFWFLFSCVHSCSTQRFLRFLRFLRFSMGVCPKNNSYFFPHESRKNIFPRVGQNKRRNAGTQEIPCESEPFKTETQEHAINAGSVFQSGIGLILENEMR